MPANIKITTSGQAPLDAILPPDWLLDLAGHGFELQHLNGNALVLVDRDPLAGTPCGMAADQRGVRGLRGAALTLIGEVTQVSDNVMHGIYSGMVAGTAVLMDQYVDCRNGVPRTIVRVISRVNGGHPGPVFDLDAHVLGLIGGKGYKVDPRP